MPWISGCGGQNAEQISKQCSERIVKVICYDAFGAVMRTGSGVILGPAKGGYAFLADYQEEDPTLEAPPGSSDLVTNFHVINEAAFIVVENAKGEAASATVLHFERKPDLALLRVPESWATTELSINATPKIGEACFAISHPLGGTLAITDGVLSAIPDENGHVLQTSTPISPGSSGGGLFDDRGSLLGILTATLVNGQNYNLAVSMSAIKLGEIKDLRRLPAERIDKVPGTDWLVGQYKYEVGQDGWLGGNYEALMRLPLFDRETWFPKEVLLPNSFRTEADYVDWLQACEDIHEMRKTAWKRIRVSTGDAGLRLKDQFQDQLLQMTEELYEEFPSTDLEWSLLQQTSSGMDVNTMLRVRAAFVAEHPWHIDSRLNVLVSSAAAGESAALRQSVEGLRGRIPRAAPEHDFNSPMSAILHEGFLCRAGHLICSELASQKKNLTDRDLQKLWRGPLPDLAPLERLKPPVWAELWQQRFMQEWWK